jgi:chemotaxis protein MotA
MVMTTVKNKKIWSHGKMNIIGVVLFFGLFCAGFAISGDIGIYANLSGFVIVIGGTSTAVFLAYRTERISIL